MQAIPQPYACGTNVNCPCDAGSGGGGTPGETQILQLQGSVETYAGSTAMFSNPLPVDGWVYFLRYLVTPDDAQGGPFYYDIASVAAPDGVNVIASVTGVGRYLRFQFV